MSACPEWCTRTHPADHPVHGRELGGVEVNSTAIDVDLFQYHDQPAQVVLYIHTGGDEDGETLAIHLPPSDAETLRACLAVAVERLGGAS